MNVLIIEDTQDIAASIYDYLENMGYTIDAASDGVTGLHLAVTKEYDIVILDLNLPGIDGVDLCRRIRRDVQKVVPVLMLTSRDSLDNKLEGFHSGADDYMTKPFCLKELAARVKVLSERGKRLPDSQLMVGDLVLDTHTHKVSRAGRQINLNPKLFRIILYFMQNPHRVIEREELEYAVWRDNPPDSDSLRTHLCHLRQVIDKPFDQPLLHTVRGFGYKLTDDYAEND
ncbi:response regulator transcription factor [Nitrosomonas marina]|uniref:DNA-binding response regulator, OmpR family, contains REC and winged-helix (WHTH) domain n=1 Tax=Nitrosomonas marina TaxID=917 RepID=A0A1H8EPA3_9PROT|nr:response regulator transcription factor [Nitrosomonas marina]SEN21315.1 DNA-binding response regulator, OmpR family, contains REC and winged-helix (wHTH) domain [Nitrosomonas marina]